jgi:hypothetical protein
MNPTGLPFSPYAEQPPPPRDAKADLNVPSLLLLIFGGLSVLYDLVTRLRSKGDEAEQIADFMRQLKVPEDVWRRGVELATGPVANAVSIFAVLLVLVMMAGAWQMRSLKNWPLAVAACVIGLLPCGQGCCCAVTLPVSIWALVLLTKPEVRAQFT